MNTGFKERMRSVRWRGDLMRGKQTLFIGLLFFGVESGYSKESKDQNTALQQNSSTISNSEKAGIEWIRIPGGSFLMGSENGGDEKPIHKVAVKSFEIAKTPITNRQYRACVDAGACAPIPKDCVPSSFQEDDQPVVCIDWHQSRVFAGWVGGRLPSEAEWEYAARSGGKDRKYPWGDEEATCKRAVMSDGKRLGCGRGRTWPVCSKPSGNTDQGLCDMSGNVWEWIEDVYHDSYKGAPSDGGAWESPAGSNRVMRSGSFTFVASNLRTTARGWLVPKDVVLDVGFRPVRPAR